MWHKVGHTHTRARYAAAVFAVGYMVQQLALPLFVHRALPKSAVTMGAAALGAFAWGTNYTEGIGYTVLHAAWHFLSAAAVLIVAKAKAKLSVQLYAKGKEKDDGQ